MAVSKAQQRATAKYEAKAYDKTLIRLPKGRLDEIRAHIEPAGESLNGFIGRAITETMERDGSGPVVPGVAPGERVLAETATGGPQETAGAPQRAAGEGAQLAPVDKAEAAKQLLDTLGKLGTVDLEGGKCERLGIVQLPPDALESIQQATERTGEAPVVFVARAVNAQVQRDKSSLALGINPATGDKLEREV